VDGTGGIEEDVRNYRKDPANKFGVGICLVFMAPVALAVAIYTSLRGAMCAVSSAWTILIEQRLSGGILHVNVPKDPESESDPDPAFLAYMYNQIWRDLRTTAVTVRGQFREEIQNINNWGHKRLIEEPRATTFVPLWSGYFGGICLGCMMAVLGLAAIAITQVVLLVAVCVALITMAGGLAACEHATRIWNRIRLSCPYGPCSKPISLPEYVCPGCKSVHRHLVPGFAGVFRHVCRCGTSLPTAVLIGRYRLAAQCPHCQTRLPSRAGRVTVVELPFVGGTAAGKSTLLNLIVDGLRNELRECGGHFEFVNPWDEDRFKEGRDQFRAGYRLAKTLGDRTRAVIFDMKPARSRGRIAYFFDLSGEVTGTSKKLRTQPYLARTPALAVVVDPLAMPAVVSSLTQEENMRVRNLDQSMAEDSKFGDPASIMQRFAQVRSDGTAKLERLAVIVTKKDILSTTGIGAPLAHKTEPVESWLRRLRLRNELEVLSQQAREVRYLASGFDDDGRDLLGLVQWVIGLDDQKVSTWHWPSRRRAASPVRHPWPARDLKGRIPPSYQLGRIELLSSSVLAAIAGPILLILGLAYLFSLFL
jgi:hypothetical protein